MLQFYFTNNYVTFSLILPYMDRFGYCSCADPDSFVRGGPTLTFFFVLFFCFVFKFMRGNMIQIALKATFRCRADDGQTLNAVLVAFWFSGYPDKYC